MPLGGWSQESQVNINPNSPVGLTNYQVKLSVQGNDPAATGYVDWTYVNADGSDFRFTDSDQSTLIDFWMYAFNNTAKTASFVVEVPSFTAATSKSIYIFYGNAVAASASSYSNTMARKVAETNDLCIVYINEGSGTTFTDQTANVNNFTLSDALAWNGSAIGVNSLDTLGVDNKFSGDNAFNGNGSSYHADCTGGLLNTGVENVEINCVVNFNASFSSAATINQFLFTKESVSTKVLYSNLLYYAENTGGTLLDSCPNYFYIEFGVKLDTVTGTQTIFQKVNTEGASRDSVTIYMSGSTLKLEVYKSGTLKINVALGTLSSATLTHIRIALGALGYAYWKNMVLITSGVGLSDSSLPTSGTARDAIWGAANYGGTYTNILDGRLYSPRIYDTENEANVCYYPLLESAGTTIADHSGNSHTLTASSASIWDTAKTVVEGYNGFFNEADGTFVLRVWRCGVLYATATAKTSWAAGTDFRIRCCTGYEGHFIYVNEDCDTLGGKNFTYRCSAGGGTDDGTSGGKFTLGYKWSLGASSAYLNAKVAYLNVSKIHFSKRKALANYEFRKITSDPFVKYGVVMSNTNISTSWGGGEKDFGEHSVIDLGTGTWQYIGAAVGRDTSSGYRVKYIHLASSTDYGRTWTDYASDPILTGYGRPHLLLDMTGVATTVSGNYYLYAIDNATSGTASNLYLFTASDFTSTITNQGVVMSSHPTYTISTATGDGTTTTLTTTVNHDYVVGEVIFIDGSAAGLNTTGVNFYTVASIPAANQITFLSTFNGTTSVGRVSSFDSKSLGNCRPWYDADLATYVMLYDGLGYTNSEWWEGRATSANGTTWTKDVVHNPVIKGNVGSGTLGSFDVIKQSGVYYALGHGALTGGVLPTEIIYYTSTDTVTWTYNSSNTPFIQRAEWISSDQLGDPFIISHSSVPEVLMIQDQIPFQGPGFQALYIASGYTVEQVLNPEPTIGYAGVVIAANLWPFNPPLSGGLKSLGNMQG